MQQTENLSLNLIETGDPISPAPLNENAQKLEAAIAAEAASRQSADAAEAASRAAGDQALAARVTTLEGHKIAIGSYHGSNSAQSFQVGFTPRAVFVQRLASTVMVKLAIAPGSIIDNRGCEFKIVEGGFYVYGDNPYTNSNDYFIYLAIR